ncbi:MAG TPA: hypothetical protein VF602_13120 [Pedobacter sp.]
MKAYIFGFLLIALLGFSGYFFFKNKNQTEIKSLSYTSNEDIEQIRNELNQKFTYLEIAKLNPSLALVTKEGKQEDVKPKAQYVVSIQDKYVREVRIFEAKKYDMRINGDPLKVKDAADICDAIDKTLTEKDTILKALQDSQIKAQVSLALWGVLNIGGEMTPPKVMLVEMAAALRKAAGIKAPKIEILIKGYADGQTSPWTEKLLPAPYHYNTVNVYPSL